MPPAASAPAYPGRGCRGTGCVEAGREVPEAASAFPLPGEDRKVPEAARFVANDPERTPSVHRSTSESAVPKGTTFGRERFGEPTCPNQLLDDLVGAQ